MHDVFISFFNGIVDRLVGDDMSKLTWTYTISTCPTIGISTHIYPVSLKAFIRSVSKPKNAVLLEFTKCDPNKILMKSIFNRNGWLITNYERELRIWRKSKKIKH
jgi:hypothetical protein